VLGSNCVQLDCICLWSNCVEREGICLGGKLFETGLFILGWGTFFVTGLYGFVGKIVWNWTAYVWGANHVEMECIDLGKWQIVWDRTVYDRD
jgi:hypothetical protein